MHLETVKTTFASVASPPAIQPRKTGDKQQTCESCGNPYKDTAVQAHIPDKWSQEIFGVIDFDDSCLVNPATVTQNCFYGDSVFTVRQQCRIKRSRCLRSLQKLVVDAVIEFAQFGLVCSWRRAQYDLAADRSTSW